MRLFHRILFNSRLFHQHYLIHNFQINKQTLEFDGNDYNNIVCTTDIEEDSTANEKDIEESNFQLISDENDSINIPSTSKSKQDDFHCAQEYIVEKNGSLRQLNTDNSLPSIANVQSIKNSNNSQYIFSVRYYFSFCNIHCPCLWKFSLK